MNQRPWTRLALAGFVLSQLPLLLWTYQPLSGFGHYRWIFILPSIAAALVFFNRDRWLATIPFQVDLHASGAAMDTRSFHYLGMLVGLVVAGVVAVAGAVGGGWLHAVGFIVSVAVASWALGGRTWLGAAAPSLAVLAFGLRWPFEGDARAVTLLQSFIGKAAGKLLDLVGVYHVGGLGSFALDERRIYLEDACAGAAWLMPAAAAVVGFAMASQTPIWARIGAIITTPFWLIAVGSVRCFAGVYWASTRGQVVDAPVVAAITGAIAGLLAVLLSQSFLYLLILFSRTPTNYSLPVPPPARTPHSVLWIFAILLAIVSAWRIHSEWAQDRTLEGFVRNKQAGQEWTDDEFGIWYRKETLMNQPFYLSAAGSSNAVPRLVFSGPWSGVEELLRSYRTQGWYVETPVFESIVQQSGKNVRFVECKMTHGVGSRLAYLCAAEFSEPTISEFVPSHHPSLFLRGVVVAAPNQPDVDRKAVRAALKTAAESLK